MEEAVNKHVSIANAGNGAQERLEDLMRAASRSSGNDLDKLDQLKQAFEDNFADSHAVTGEFFLGTLVSTITALCFAGTVDGASLTISISL